MLGSAAPSSPYVAFHATLVQVTAYLHAGARQFGFMLRGLQELQPRLATKNIPFFMLKVRHGMQHRVALE
jgi:deoxyribodipyrimidine photo-lyase